MSTTVDSIISGWVKSVFGKQPKAVNGQASNSAVKPENDVQVDIYTPAPVNASAEARGEIKEDKKIIRDIDEQLQNGNLAEADKIKLEEVKNKATARVKELIGKIKSEKKWSVRAAYDHEVNELTGHASDESLAEYSRANMASHKELIKSAAYQEIKDNIQYILQESKELGEIVDSIKNDDIRESLLPELVENNDFTAGQIADETLPPENASETDYVSATKFVNDVFKLPLVIIQSDLTQKILDSIADNNAKNEKADQVTYEKNLRQKKEQNIQDLKVAIRKSTEKISLLKHYARKLEDVPEDEKVKVLANILEQINKKNPVI